MGAGDDVIYLSDIHQDNSFISTPMMLRQLADEIESGDQKAFSKSVVLLLNNSNGSFDTNFRCAGGIKCSELITLLRLSEMKFIDHIRDP